MTKKKSDEQKEIEAILYRIIITVFGIMVATVFLRDKKEVMVRYGELKNDSPFIAWVVSRAFVLLMIFTVVSIGLIIVGFVNFLFSPNY